jgi:hypothetical protein
LEELLQAPPKTDYGNTYFTPYERFDQGQKTVQSGDRPGSEEHTEYLSEKYCLMVCFERLRRTKQTIKTIFG